MPGVCSACKGHDEDDRRTSLSCWIDRGSRGVTHLITGVGEYGESTGLYLSVEAANLQALEHASYRVPPV